MYSHHMIRTLPHTQHHSPDIQTISKFW